MLKTLIGIDHKNKQRRKMQIKGEVIYYTEFDVYMYETMHSDLIFLL